MTDRWEPTYDQIVELAVWMMHNDHSVSDVVYMLEKPWKHHDLWLLCQMARGLSDTV